jgi:hypothetical protein
VTRGLRRRGWLVPLLLSASGACRNPLAPAAVAGVYDLTSVGGTGGSDAPVSGRITLAGDGSAERRVTYRIGTSGALTEVVGSGTYQVVDSLVHLSLRESGGSTGSVWRPTAKLESGGRLRLDYPGPADGIIVEFYTRR